MKKFVVGIISALVVGIMLSAPSFTYEAEAFTDAEAAKIKEAQSELSQVLTEKEIMALVYLTDVYSVRESAQQNSAEVVKVTSGQSVFVKGMEVSADDELWVKVELLQNDQTYTGYIERRFLACSDEVFLQWEAEYQLSEGVDKPAVFTSADGAQTYADIAQFPESYQAALVALKEAHPNWIFVKMDTGLEWDTVVAEELYGGRSLIPTTLAKCLQEGTYSKSWAYPTEEALEYYLDPRNGLTESAIFQFEQLTFNVSYHMDCEGALQTFLNNTFMRGKIPLSDMSFAFGFWAIGKEMNISPFHLASRVYQEQGQGTSPLISGTYPGYEGYYNYFNIGASGSTDKEVIESGLKYAKNANPPWNTPYYSLHFGAKILGASYINKGQDTLYLQKFDVDNSSSGMFWHQYMQNICAPSSEAKSIRKLYEEVGALENVFVFKIPVYHNMPSSCPLPTQSDRVILGVEDGYTDATIWLDGVAYDAQSRNGYYIVHAGRMNAKSAVLYQYDTSGKPVGMKVWRLTGDGTYYKATEMTELENLFVYHGFSIRISEKAGIRYKASIASNTRELLINSGLDGYKLVEYGNLVMTNENRKKYPMIRYGEQLTYGIAYGKDENGSPIDKIFEIANDRHQFTAVLANLKPNRYKTEFSYRNYAILSNGTEEMIIYGPIVYKSIYQVAEYYLSQNIYEEGSAEYEFLKKLIADADSADGVTVDTIGLEEVY